MSTLEAVKAAILDAFSRPSPIPSIEEVFESERQQSLAALAERGDIAKLELAVSQGADLDELAPRDVSLLMYEIAKKNEIAVRALLAAGANPNALSNAGASPMAVAAASDNPRLLEMLLDRGGDPNLKNKKEEPLLHQTITFGQWQNVHTLVERGADIEAKDTTGRNAMLRLAYLNQYQEVNWMLDRGADPSVKDATGRSVRELVQKKVPNPNSPLEAWRKHVAARLGVVEPETTT